MVNRAKNPIAARVHTDAGISTGMEIPKEGQVPKRIRCRTCGKRYAVVEWKQDPKCRQWGDASHRGCGRPTATKNPNRDKFDEWNVAMLARMRSVLGPK
jgi:hypothetical protein